MKIKSSHHPRYVLLLVLDVDRFSSRFEWPESLFEHGLTSRPDRLSLGSMDEPKLD